MFNVDRTVGKWLEHVCHREIYSFLFQKESVVLSVLILKQSWLYVAFYKCTNIPSSSNFGLFWYLKVTILCACRKHWFKRRPGRKNFTQIFKSLFSSTSSDREKK